MATSGSPTANTALPPWPLLATAAGALAMLAAILIANGGTFVYTLDDPYIHLAFSEQIAHGHFGLVPGESASPSSSVLWPLLLVPFAGSAIHQYVPLALGMAALLAAVALWQRVLQVFALKALPLRDARAMAGVLAIVATLVSNHFGLAFSGMEHALQTTLALAVVAGLIELIETGRLRWWLLAGIALGPLIRYENLTFSFVGLGLLIVCGHWRWAAALLGFVAAALGAYAWVSTLAGLPPLPGSLMLKSGGDGPLLGTLRWRVLQAAGALLDGQMDASLLLPVALLLLRPLLPGPLPGRREALLIAGVVAALLAQMTIGGRQTIGRYDLYTVAAGLLAALWVNRATLQIVLARLDARRLAAIAIVLGVLCFPSRSLHLALTPLAAQDIYRQQWQMRRFLLEQIKTKVAVNDAGLTAYRNPYGIFDLVGLGSEEMRRAQAHGRVDPAYFRATLEKHDIDTLLIYENWFRRVLPPDAIKVAFFRLGRRPVTAGGETATLIATTPAAAERLRAAALAFAPSMPPGTGLLVTAPP